MLWYWEANDLSELPTSFAESAELRKTRLEEVSCHNRPHMAPSTLLYICLSCTLSAKSEPTNTANKCRMQGCQSLKLLAAEHRALSDAIAVEVAEEQQAEGAKRSNKQRRTTVDDAPGRAVAAGFTPGIARSASSKQVPRTVAAFWHASLSLQLVHLALRLAPMLHAGLTIRSHCQGTEQCIGLLSYA